MMLVLMILNIAAADPLRTTALPQTLTFAFDYPGIVSGQTTFSFLSAARTTSTPVCADLPGCMGGNFATGNGGTGIFNTDLTLDCAPTAPPVDPVDGFNFVPTTCDVLQSLDLFYNDTGALYTGGALCGTAAVDVVYNCSGPPASTCLPNPVGTANRVYALGPLPFSGTIDVFGTPGTFQEL